MGRDTLNHQRVGERPLTGSVVIKAPVTVRATT